MSRGVGTDSKRSVKGPMLLLLPLLLAGCLCTDKLDAAAAAQNVKNVEVLIGESEQNADPLVLESRKTRNADFLGVAKRLARVE